MTKRECKICGEKFTPVAEYPQSLFCNSVCESMESKINWEELAKEFKQGVKAERKRLGRHDLIALILTLLMLVAVYILTAVALAWALNMLGVEVPASAIVPLAVMLFIIRGIVK